MIVNKYINDQVTVYDDVFSIEKIRELEVENSSLLFSFGAYDNKENPVPTLLSLISILSYTEFESIMLTIDEEVVKIIRKAEKSADNILRKNEKILHAMANALLKHETIDHNDVQKLIDGKILRRRKMNGSANTVKNNSKVKTQKKSSTKKPSKS